VNSNTFAISYGTGQVSGTVATDSVTFLSKTFPLTFGIANTVSADFSDYPMDGILGVGRLENVASNPSGVKAPTIVDTLVSQNIISSKLFGLRISRAGDGGNDGEINFGAPDTAAFSGSLNYITAVKNPNGFWEIPIGSVTFNGKAASIQSGVTVLLDSGTSYMLVPQPDADAIHAVIPGSQKNGEVYSIPCNTNTPLTLTFGGQAYGISAEDYVGAKNSDGTCTSNIVARTTFETTQWLIGDVFLKNVYTVFDYDGGRIGLGQLKGMSTSISSIIFSNQVPFPTDGVSSSPSTTQSTNNPSPTHQTSLQTQTQTNASSGTSPQKTSVPNGSKTSSPSSPQGTHSSLTSLLSLVLPFPNHSHSYSHFHNHISTCRHR
jgi:Eukaryotic aspartyl protease